MTVTRRELWQSAAAGSGSAYVPILWARTDKAAAMRLFSARANTSTRPFKNGGELRALSGTATHTASRDSQGNIYVHHTVNAAVRVSTDASSSIHTGPFVRSGEANSRCGAHGISIRKEARSVSLSLRLLHGVVTKRTLTGEEVWTWGIRGNRTRTRPKIILARVPATNPPWRFSPNGDIT